MTDIEGEVAAFAATLDAAVFVDDEAFHADVVAVLCAIDLNTTAEAAGKALLTELRRMQPTTYAKAVAIEAARVLGAFICISAPTWRIAYLTQCLARFAFACRVLGYGEELSG